MSGILAAASNPSSYVFPTSSVSASEFEISPTDAYASLFWNANGTITDHNATIKGYWIFPIAGANSNYYVKANSASPGTPDSGTMDTWLQLNTSRGWTNAMLGIGVDSDTFTVEIRYGTGATLSTRNATLTAEVDV